MTPPSGPSGPGGPGSILIEGARDDNGRMRLVIADHGLGLVAAKPRQSFGSRLVQTLVQQLGGTLAREDNAPGLRVVLSFPIEG